MPYAASTPHNFAISEYRPRWSLHCSRLRRDHLGFRGLTAFDHIICTRYIFIYNEESARTLGELTDFTKARVRGVPPRSLPRLDHSHEQLCISRINEPEAIALAQRNAQVSFRVHTRNAKSIG